MEEIEMNTQVAVAFTDSFAEICGYSRPFAFQKEFHADERRSPRMNADQNHLSAKICGHPRASAFSKLFNANGRKWPRISANQD
jgi:transcriptional regulator GlxA family with amidase domain